MAIPKPPSQPPLSVDFQSTLHSSHPGAEPKQHDWKLHRASDGKMRYDHGDHSVITDPSSQKITLLDHVKKQAQVLPMPAQSAPAMPGAGPQPGSSGQANAPTNVKDLGKKMIAGHEVEGKSYTLPSPKPPVAPPSVAPPKPPKVSAPPPAPGAPPSIAPPSAAPPKPPQASAPPLAPGAPPSPQVSPPKPPGPPTIEVWTSHKLQMPLASSVTGASGKTTTTGKQVTTGEPHPSMFQIPPDYKLIPPPKAPTPSS
jgi:hypothetical protein